jgi:hypothetical protein
MYCYNYSKVRCTCIISTKWLDQVIIDLRYTSDYFGNDTGLIQGETLSPILFSLYVNDFEICFIKNNCTSRIYSRFGLSSSFGP